MRIALWSGLLAGAGLALAQGTGSIEGMVLESPSQGPVRKAQVVLIYRGGMQGQMPMAQGMTGVGGVSVTAVPPPNGVISFGRVGGSMSPAPMPAGRAMTGVIGAMPGGMPGAMGPQQPSAAMTDVSGGFAFHNVAPGSYEIMANHSRFPQIPGASQARGVVEVKSGETARLNLTLKTPGSVSGRVVDEDGEPLPGCMIQVRGAGGSEFRPSGMNEPSNERGEYRVYGLPAGKYIALAQCMRPVFQPRPFSAGPPPVPTFGYPAVYYPQAADTASATVLEIAGGMERTGIDFQVKPARVFSVSGVVSGMDGANRNISLMLAKPKDRTGTGSRGGRVDRETGGFEIPGVFPGSYVLVATQFPTDANSVALSVRQSIEVTDRPMRVNVTLQKGGDIPGSITIEGQTQIQPQQVHISVTPDEPTMGVPPPQVVVQQDGSFLMKNTAAGLWRLAAFGPNVFLKSIEVGGQTLSGQVLDTSNGMAGPIRVVVSTRTAKVQGRGNPGTMYALIPEEGDPRFPHPFIAHADGQGTVSMAGIAPGKYGVYEGAVADESMLLQWVTVSEGATLDLDMTKRPAGAR